MKTIIQVSISLIIFCVLATNAYALSEAQINNMAESKEWVIGANPGAGGYLYTKRKWQGPKDYNYNLKGLVLRKFFHYEKQGSLGGINLGWTDNASASTGKKRAQWYFTRKSNVSGPIKYGEPLAIAWAKTGYLRYASRNSGINLDWSKTPYYQWKILGGKNGTPVQRGKDKVIIYNTRHKYPMIYYKRKGAGHIGWPDSTDWSVRGRARDAAIVTKNVASDIATKPLRDLGLVGRAEIDTYNRLKSGQRNCKKQRDTCTNCSPPGRNDDKDRDGIPDLLEYNLAHKFYPNVMVYGDKYDLQQTLLKKGYSSPYIVKEIGGGQCGNDNEKKCLEIRLGITYVMDGGDEVGGGYGSHIGDSEVYMAVVKRNGSWAQAKNNANEWQIIRDFTTAHWGTPGDDSKMKTYPSGRSERVTIHSATRKHALYHSNKACDEGVYYVDDCPGKGRNLIQYKKRNSLQNIGSRNNNIGMDTTIAHPVCGVYHVWGDRAYGEDDPFSKYMEDKVAYKLGSKTPASSQVSDHRTDKRTSQVSDHRIDKRTSQVNDHRTDKRTSQVNDHRTDKRTSQVNDHRTDKRTSQVNDHRTDKRTSQFNDHRTDKRTSQVRDHRTDKRTSQVNDHRTDKRTSQVRDHRTDKRTSQVRDHRTDKRTSQVRDHRTDKRTSQVRDHRTKTRPAPRAAYPTSPPPRPQYLPVPKPRAGFVWIRGHYKWRSGAYAWTRGHWEGAKAKKVWVEGKWSKQGKRWHWTPGYWKGGSRAVRVQRTPRK